MHKKHVIHGWGEQVDSHREQMVTARNEQKRMENQMEMDRLASLEKERQSQETKLQEEKELAGQLKDQVNELRQREAEVQSHEHMEGCDFFVFNRKFSSSFLKTVDTIGNCQRLVFTVRVSQHMHKITNL